MPVEVLIDVENNLVHRKLIGRVSAAEVLESIETVFNDPDFDPRMKSLNDLREVINTADTEYIMELAQAMIGYSGELGSTQIAIVVSTDVIFGMIRMLQSYISESPLDVMVFKDLNEAMAWLEA